MSAGSTVNETEVPLGTGQADGAAAINLADAVDRRISGHSAADDQVHIVRYGSLMPSPSSTFLRISASARFLVVYTTTGSFASTCKTPLCKLGASMLAAIKEPF